MKLNKKGFTLIEVLATIIILGIIVVIIFPYIYKYLGNAEKNNQKVFKNRLIESIDSYITSNTNILSFSKDVYKTIEKVKGEGTKTQAKVYKSNNEITLQNIVDENIISAPIKNPKNKKECALDTKIQIFRDSDYVYCYKIENIDCLDDFEDTEELENIINTCNFEIN